jgi:hypothetical protein
VTIHAATGSSSNPFVGRMTAAYLGPLYFYLLALPVSVSLDPLAPVVFVALVQLGAVLALYRFAAEFWGARVGAYAGALFAVFPLTLFSGRLVWHVGLLPLLVVWTMHALCRLVVRGSSAAVVPLAALVAMATQMHLTAVALAVVAVLAVLAFRPRIRMTHLAAAGALVVLLYLPLLMHEAGTGFANLRALLAAAGQGAPRLDAWARVMAHLLSLHASALDAFIDERDWPTPFLATFRTLYRLEAGLVFCGLAVCLWRLGIGWRRASAGAATDRSAAPVDRHPAAARRRESRTGVVVLPRRPSTGAVHSRRHRARHAGADPAPRGRWAAPGRDAARRGARRRRGRDTGDIRPLVSAPRQ